MSREKPPPWEGPGGATHLLAGSLAGEAPGAACQSHSRQATVLLRFLFRVYEVGINISIVTES